MARSLARSMGPSRALKVSRWYVHTVSPNDIDAQRHLLDRCIFAKQALNTRRHDNRAVRVVSLQHTNNHATILRQEQDLMIDVALHAGHETEAAATQRTRVVGLFLLVVPKSRVAPVGGPSQPRPWPWAAAVPPFVRCRCLPRLARCACSHHRCGSRRRVPCRSDRGRPFPAGSRRGW